jgi:hypothetical protein
MRALQRRTPDPGVTGRSPEALHHTVGEADSCSRPGRDSPESCPICPRIRPISAENRAHSRTRPGRDSPAGLSHEFDDSGLFPAVFSPRPGRDTGVTPSPSAVRRFSRLARCRAHSPGRYSSGARCRLSRARRRCRLPWQPRHVFWVLRADASATNHSRHSVHLCRADFGLVVAMRRLSRRPAQITSKVDHIAAAEWITSRPPPKPSGSVGSATPR